MLRWVRMSRYCELSGDTPDGVDKRLRTGKWLRDEFPPPDDDWMSVGIDCAADLTVTLIRVPARFSHLCVKVDAKDFQSQRGRSLIAATLRSMRRQSLRGAQEKAG